GLKLLAVTRDRMRRIADAGATSQSNKRAVRDQEKRLKASSKASGGGLKASGLIPLPPKPLQKKRLQASSGSASSGSARKRIVPERIDVPQRKRIVPERLNVPTAMPPSAFAPMPRTKPRKQPAPKQKLWARNTPMTPVKPATPARKPDVWGLAPVVSNDNNAPIPMRYSAQVARPHGFRLLGKKKTKRVGLAKSRKPSVNRNGVKRRVLGDRYVAANNNISNDENIGNYGADNWLVENNDTSRYVDPEYAQLLQHLRAGRLK
ncbi:MAG: hypothetical protein EBZ91_13980, partial [Gammaproteobacteria bacterium]|nr:hypothetical protein [Gammaproteobacteria bacterium]